MRVTYINHSGFFIELEHTCLLFDYYRGEFPRVPKDKAFYVFVSHAHADHYNLGIWEHVKDAPAPVYLLSKDCKPSAKRREKYGIPSEESGQVRYLAPDKKYIIQGRELKLAEEWKGASSASSVSSVASAVSVKKAAEQKETAEKEFTEEKTAEKEITEKKTAEKGRAGELAVYTLRSTDEGVAFVVETEGKRLYHAGDLNLWVWDEESDAYNADMRARFAREMDKLKGQRFDLAFVPLDPRQEADAYLGLESFLQTADASAVFPMHFWNDFDIIERFRRDHAGLAGTEKILSMHKDGECYEI